MDNHYHLLVETLEANLARAMRALNGGHAQQFNRAHHRVGHLFGRRYKAILVDRDSYLLELSRYIHLNPVRAGIVESADRYRWSSAQAYVGDHAAPAFLTIGELLGHFGNNMRRARRRYSEFLREGEKHAPNSPLNDVTCGILLGDAEWVREIRARVDACLETGRIGRDRVEIPDAARMRLRPTVDQVIEAVGAAMNVRRECIVEHHSRHRARAVAIYLADGMSGLKQREVAQAFGIGRFAVSKAAAMIKLELPQDRRLQRRIARLRGTLTLRS
jgi:hypothetical protein